MEYAIETLKIEKYKLIDLKRQIIISAHEARTTAFDKEISDICDKLKQLDWAIAELKKELK